MQSRCVQYAQSGPDILPLLQGRAIFVRILCQTILANIIEERMLLFEVNPGRRRGVIFRRLPLGGIRKFLELVCLETAVIAAHPLTVYIGFPLLVILEVVHQFFPEGTARIRIWHVCSRIVFVVHCPCPFQGDTVFLLENIIGVQHEVVEIIGSTHHTSRNIIVVQTFVLLVHFLAVASDPAKLKVHLAHQVEVFLCRYLFPARIHVNEPSDQARFRIGDFDRLVGAEKQEALKLVCISAPEFLIHHHRLVGNERVQPGIVLDV